MDQLEKLIDKLCDSNDNSIKINHDIASKPIDDQVNLMDILKSFITERKKMWNSLLDYVNLFEEDEKCLLKILELDEIKLDDLKQDDETMFDNSTMEITAMDSTFTRHELKFDNNSMCFDKTAELSLEQFQNLIKPKLTPIVKPDKKKERKQKNNLFERSLPTINEFSTLKTNRSN